MADHSMAEEKCPELIKKIQRNKQEHWKSAEETAESG